MDVMSSKPKIENILGNAPGTVWVTVARRVSRGSTRSIEHLSDVFADRKPGMTAACRGKGLKPPGEEGFACIGSIVQKI